MFIFFILLLVHYIPPYLSLCHYFCCFIPSYYLPLYLLLYIHFMPFTSFHFITILLPQFHLLPSHISHFLHPLPQLFHMLLLSSPPHKAGVCHPEWVASSPHLHVFYQPQVAYLVPHQLLVVVTRGFVQIWHDTTNVVRLLKISF